MTGSFDPAGWHALQQLQATYAAVVDAGDWDAWSDLVARDVCDAAEFPPHHDPSGG